MAQDLGSLQTDPLFLGLTRPAMLAGVTFTYFAFEMMVAMIGFVITSNFACFLLAGGLHGIGVYLCKKEPLMIEMFLTKFQKTPAVQNKQFHGGLNSYNMFD